MSAAQLALFPDPAPRQKRKANVHIVPAERVQHGDLWQLNGHRLLCGDANNGAHVARLLCDERVDACITDPPYGVNWNTDYRRFNGSVERNYLRVANDSKQFDPTSLLRFRSVVLWGANCYPAFLSTGSMLVWDKRWRSGKSFLTDGEVAWMNRGHGTYIYSLAASGSHFPDVRFHPTQKPVALIEWCMRKAKAGSTVYDPYLGSGTTLIACERTQRRCYGMEIEPLYCDVILARWEQATHQTATLLKREAQPA